MAESLQHYKNLLPREITVITTKTDEGFVAEVKELSHCYTQADSFSELIEMVNDAILTYFDVPQEYVDRLGLVYLPEGIFNELKRFQFQEAWREINKDISASSSIFRRASLA